MTTRTVTITLPDELEKALEIETRRQGAGVDTVVTDALRRYLFLRRFNELQEDAIQRAQAQGIHSEEDVFEIIS